MVAETGAELMERIQNLINLVQVMIGQNLDPTLRASLDNAMTTYYEGCGGRRRGRQLVRAVWAS